MHQSVITFCSICERTCGMSAYREKNTITKVIGYAGHVRSKGGLCVKGRAARDILYAADRLRVPMIKTGGSWRALSWQDAFDLLAEKLLEVKQKHGPESLAVYHGQTYLKNCLAMALMKRLLRVYGTPNLCSAASECFVPQLLAGITTFGGLPLPDILNSRCLMVWGTNPCASGSIVGCSMPRTRALLKRLKQNGVSFIVVDPRNSEMAALANLHLRVRPGTDGALACAMLRILIDEGLYDTAYVEQHTFGFDKLHDMLRCVDLDQIAAQTVVPLSDIYQAAQLFATVKPASIMTGVGVEHHTNAVQTLRAIMILLALTGNVDVPGGNTFFPPVMLSFPDQDELPAPSCKPIGMDEHPMFTGMINQAHALVLLEKILAAHESPIQALVVAGGAPIPELANTNKVRAAFQKIPFKAVIDLFMTPSAREADLVLPAAFFLERDEIGTMPLNRQRKVVEPDGPLADWEIWLHLARRMGYERYFPWENFQDAADALLKSAGMSCAELDQHPGGIINEMPTGTFLQNGFYTYSGKIELYSHALAAAGYDPLPSYREPLESPESAPDIAATYPLVLTTGGRQEMFVHSQHRTIKKLRQLNPEPYAEIHPDTAQQYGIGDKESERIRISSLRGSITMKLKITDNILPGVVHLPHGWDKADCNLLTDHEKRDPISGFPGLRSSLCRVEKL
ncbi:MAG: molybdopterin-dependent oxidoreductase [Desulfobacterota bacterium]|nr:molybdopterin-dependent oxidoreductase [Thermodesulfobacteriota bacterium]